MTTVQHPAGDAGASLIFHSHRLHGKMGGHTGVEPAHVLPPSAPSSGSGLVGQGPQEDEDQDQALGL